VLVAKLIDLQLDQDMTLQYAVIEYQSHEGACVANDDALLLRLQAETIPQLQKKLPQVSDKGCF